MLPDDKNAEVLDRRNLGLRLVKLHPLQHQYAMEIEPRIYAWASTDYLGRHSSRSADHIHRLRFCRYLITANLTRYQNR